MYTDFIRQRILGKLPRDVEEDLYRAVSLLVNTDAPIDQIRLFGSLNNGRWRRQERNGRKSSDIDLAVFVDNIGVAYSWFSQRLVYRDEWQEVYRDTPEVCVLVDALHDPSLVKFTGRYALHMATYADLARIEKEGIVPTGDLAIFGRQDTRPFIHAMRSGRLLYQRDNE